MDFNKFSVDAGAWVVYSLKWLESTLEHIRSVGKKFILITEGANTGIKRRHLFTAEDGAE